MPAAGAKKVVPEIVFSCCVRRRKILIPSPQYSNFFNLRPLKRELAENVEFAYVVDAI